MRLRDRRVTCDLQPMTVGLCIVACRALRTWLLSPSHRPVLHVSSPLRPAICASAKHPKPAGMIAYPCYGEFVIIGLGCGACDERAHKRIMEQPPETSSPTNGIALSVMSSVVCIPVILTSTNPS